MRNVQSERRRRRTTVVRFGLALGLGAVAACSSDSGDGGAATTIPTSVPAEVTTTGAEPSEAETSVPTTSVEIPVTKLELPEPNIATGPFAAGESFSILSALGQIPLEIGVDENGKTEIYIADLLAAGDASGHPRPTGSTDFDEVVEWLLAMDGTDESIVFAPVPFNLQISAPELVGYTDEVGFGVTDVDASIELALAPNSLTILAGSLEHASTTEVAEGVFTFGEGEDFTVDFDDRTTARELGRPLRVASQDGLVLLSPSTDVASLWLDPESPRLDSVPLLAAVAEALDSQGVLGAVLFQNDFSADRLLSSLDPSIADALEIPITEPFGTIGLGWGAIGGEGTLTIVYAFAEETAANAMAPIIEDMFVNDAFSSTSQPVSELLVVDNVEVQDQVVVVSLRMVPGSGIPRTTLTMVSRSDIPFMFRLDDN